MVFIDVVASLLSRQLELGWAEFHVILTFELPLLLLTSPLKGIDLVKCLIHAFTVALFVLLTAHELVRIRVVQVLRLFKCFADVHLGKSLLVPHKMLGQVRPESLINEGLGRRGMVADCFPVENTLHQVVFLLLSHLFQGVSSLLLFNGSE